MTRRLLPLALFVFALLVPLGAQAATLHFGTVSGPEPAKAPRATLHKARTALLDGQGVRKGADITPLLKELALKLPTLSGAEHKRAVDLLERPSQGEGGFNELEYEVAEQPPLCSAHFCVHWVKTTDDAPPLADSNHNGTPDYVETMGGVFEHVYDVENVELGWKPPKSDGTRGCLGDPTPACTDKTDVYIKEIGSQGIYGYAAPDPDQNSFHQYAYLVMDDDYNGTQFPRYEGNPLQPMEVTAAHEYNHVLQFNYDTGQDTWLFESTATWMEDRLYTDVNDYIQYLKPWSQMSFVPLTYFSSGDDALNVKVYGDAVFPRWVQGHFGDNTIRDAWAAPRSATKSFAPAAYNISLGARGSSFYSAFSTFAADTAEWRASNSPFAEGVTFPDMDRALVDDRTKLPITLTPDGTGAAGTLSHTAYVLLDVEPAAVPTLKLAVNTPRGVRMAIALIGRTGDEENGASTRFIKLLPNGGPATVAIDNPGQYERLTAAVVNADTSKTRYSSDIGDWLWTKDEEPINARVSVDVHAPRVTHRWPHPGARRTSRYGHVSVTFSERMFELSTRSVKLVAPNGRSVKAKLSLSTKGRKARAEAGARKFVLKPLSPLRGDTRYELRLSRDLRDYGGNALPSSALEFAFRTRG